MRFVIQILLWAVIIFLAYLTFNAVYEPLQFNKVKEKRYTKVVKNLKDIRDAELAHKEITGRFTGSFDSLVKFIDTAEFAITQRRDTVVLDEEYQKTYGVDKNIEKTIIDTLGFVPVKDSLYKGNSDRYRNMKNVPIEGANAEFELRAGTIKKGDNKIPVFEARIPKSKVLFDQDKQLVLQENEVQAVDDINGRYIAVGSMTEVTTSGNGFDNYGGDKKEN